MIILGESFLNKKSANYLFYSFKNFLLKNNKFTENGINVNIVSPGFITTDMTNKLNESQKEEILSKIPMKKFGEPIDVANLVYFLSNDNSSYITGQNFNVNGGMLMF